MKQFEKLTTESGKLKLESAAARWLRVFLLLSAFSFQLSAFQPAFSQYVPRYDGGGGGGGGGVVDGLQLFDGSHVLAADFGTRQLHGEAGNEIAEWNETVFEVYRDFTVYDPLGPNLFSVGPDVGNVRFGKTDGSVAVYISDSGMDSNIPIHSDSLLNESGDYLANIDLLTRTLFAADGTEALSYDNRLLSRSLPAPTLPEMGLETVEGSYGELKATGIESLFVNGVTLNWDAATATYAGVYNGGIISASFSTYPAPAVLSLELFLTMSLVQWQAQDFSTNDGYAGDYYEYNPYTGWFLSQATDLSNVSTYYPAAASLLSWDPTSSGLVGWEATGGAVTAAFVETQDSISFGGNHGSLYSYKGEEVLQWGVGFGQGYVQAPKILGIDIRYAGDGKPNIDLGQRKLFNPDGTTVAIDYGTQDAVSFFNYVGGFVQSDGTWGFGHLSEVPGSIQVASGSDFTVQDGVYFYGLPTSDPAVAGQLWNDAGTLKVSAGP